jgi:ArsR family transcriptional regulator
MYSALVATTQIEHSLAQRLKAVADETRIRILHHLGGDERCVCELTEALDIGQSLLSFHLRILKEAGLVSDHRAGRWSYYVIEPEALRDLGAMVAALGSPASKGGRQRRSCRE